MLFILLMIHKIQTSFQFPHIPPSIAKSYIHTPECFMRNHMIKSPFLRVADSSPPSKAGEYNVIAFKLKTIFSTLPVRMLSKSSDESHVFLMDSSERASMMATFNVKPLSRSGHSLSISQEYFQNPSGHATYNLLFYKYTRWKIACSMLSFWVQRDSHLRAYLRLVLSKLSSKNAYEIKRTE